MGDIKTVEDFKAYVEEQKKQSWWKEPLAFGVARAEYGQLNQDKVIGAFIPVVNWQENYGSFAVWMSVLLNHDATEAAMNASEMVVDIPRKAIEEAAAIFAPFMDDLENHANVNVVKQMMDLPAEDKPCRFRFVVLFADEAVQSVEAAYLKLIAMSEGHVKPRTINFDGVFGVLPNVAWVGNKPVEMEYLRQNKAKLQLSGEYPHIDYNDKLPRFLHHVIPADNTRIIDSGKVRVGAHLAAGTTVMPGASYINFNAGTLGPVMVEGRVSSSVVVGAGTDIGGGASILGVLSGGNTTPIGIGESGLLGANAVCGIPLGDGCIIDAGVTVLAGSKVKIRGDQLKALAEVNDSSPAARDDETYKAVDLSGMNGLHFRQNSTTGVLEAFRSSYEIKLNEALH